MNKINKSNNLIFIIAVLLILLCIILNLDNNSEKFINLKPEYKILFTLSNVKPQTYKVNISNNIKNVNISYIKMMQQFDQVFNTLIKNLNVKYYKEVTQNYKSYATLINKLSRGKYQFRERFNAIKQQINIAIDQNSNYYVSDNKGNLSLIHIKQWSQYFNYTPPLQTLITVYSKKPNSIIYGQITEKYKNSEVFNSVIVQKITSYDTEDFSFIHRVYKQKRIPDEFCIIENRDREFFYYYEEEFENGDKTLEEFIKSIQNELGIIEFGTYTNTKDNRIKIRYKLNNLSLGRIFAYALENEVIFGSN